MSDQTRQVIEMLKAAGYEPLGCTPSYKMITMNSYPLPGKTINGRDKYGKPGTALRATVGARTTCFYRVKNKQACEFENFPTKDIDSIRTFLEGKTDE